MATHLPGELHGQRILMGYSPCSCKAPDTTNRLTPSHTFITKAKIIKTVIISNAGDNAKILNHSHIAGVYVNNTTTAKKSFVALRGCPNNHSLEHLSQNNKNICLLKNIYVYVYSNVIYTGPQLFKKKRKEKPRCLSTDEFLSTFIPWKITQQ